MVVLRESLAGENAIAKVIPNGLAREARNRKRVGLKLRQDESKQTTNRPMPSICSGRASSDGTAR